MYDDAHADRIAEARLATQPIWDAVLTGAVVCFILPAFLALFGLIMIFENPPMALGMLATPVFGAVFGGLGGLVVGAIDAPGRLAVTLARRESPLALLLMSQLGGVIIGGPWFALVAAAAGITIGGVIALADRSGMEILLAFSVTAWFYGLFLGMPGAVMHATARALQVANRSPRFLPVLAAGATTAGVIVWLTWAWFALAGLVMLAEKLSKVPF